MIADTVGSVGNSGNTKSIQHPQQHGIDWRRKRLNLNTTGGWFEGRQGTGYLRKTLLSLSFMDAHILKYPVGTFIPAHKDPIPGRKHYRLNIRLKGPDNFMCKWTIFRWWRICLFRPDQCLHSVNVCNEERIVLSIGVAI